MIKKLLITWFLNKASYDKLECPQKTHPLCLTKMNTKMSPVRRKAFMLLTLLVKMNACQKGGCEWEGRKKGRMKLIPI